MTNVRLYLHEHTALKSSYIDFLYRCYVLLLLVFSLKKKHGLTNEEIAKHNKISIKSVEAHITKAFKLLRNKVRKFKY